MFDAVVQSIEKISGIFGTAQRLASRACELCKIDLSASAKELTRIGSEPLTRCFAFTSRSTASTSNGLERCSKSSGPTGYEPWRRVTLKPSCLAMGGTPRSPDTGSAMRSRQARSVGLCRTGHKRSQRDLNPVSYQSESARAAKESHKSALVLAAARSCCTSRIGGAPKTLLYSRLK